VFTTTTRATCSATASKNNFGVARDFHCHFVAGPQFLDELPQIFQLPLRQIRPLVLQTDATSEAVAVPIDSDIAFPSLSPGCFNSAWLNFQVE